MQQTFLRWAYLYNPSVMWITLTCNFIQTEIVPEGQPKLEWAASNGNRYPPYPQVMATAISQ